jgi:hypothetical protein
MFYFNLKMGATCMALLKENYQYKDRINVESRQ